MSFNFAQITTIIFINIGLLLLALLFWIVIWLLTKPFLNKTLNRIYSIFSFLAWGGFTILLNFLQLLWTEINVVPYEFIVPIVIALLINPVTGILTLFLLWVVMVSNSGIEVQSSVAFLITFIILLSTFYFYYKLKIKKLYSLSIVVIADCIALIIIYTTTVNSEILMSTNLYGVLFLILGVFSLAILYMYSETVAESAFVLNNVNQFVFEDFIRSSLAFKEIRNHINAEKIEVGSFATFSFQGLKNITLKHGEKLINSLLTELRSALKQEFLSKQVLLFEITKGQYGVFQKEEGIESLLNEKGFTVTADWLRNSKIIGKNLAAYERVILKIQSFVRESQQKGNIEARCAVSYYGIHSQEISELSEYNQKNLFQKSGFTGSQFVQIFDAELWHNSIVERRKFDAIRNLLPISDMLINYMPVVSSSNSKIIFYNSRYTIRKSDRFQDVGSFFRYTRENFLLDTTLRYFAGLSINQYVLQKKINKQLSINYDANVINSSFFNPYELISKIKSFNIDVNRIILDLSINFFPKINDSLKNKIVFFKRSNLTLLLSEYDWTNDKHREYIHVFKPKYIILKPDTINKFEKDKKLISKFHEFLSFCVSEKVVPIIVNIDSHNLLVVAIRAKTPLLCGEYIGVNVFAEDISTTVQLELGDMN